jgi:protein TonB
MNTLHPHHISKARLRNTIAAVLLAHAGLLWIAQRDLAEFSTSDESGQVMMADVVSDMPNPAPATPTNLSRQRTPIPTPTTSVTHPDSPALTPNNSNAQAAAPGSPSTAAHSDALGKTGTPSWVEPSADADYLKNPPPAYPRTSRRMGEQGTVIVRVFISSQGLPEKAEVRTSSGFARLDQAALEAVQRWRFVPGRRSGTPEAMWFNIPVRFVLE